MVAGIPMLSHGKKAVFPFAKLSTAGVRVSAFAERLRPWVRIASVVPTLSADSVRSASFERVFPMRRKIVSCKGSAQERGGVYVAGGNLEDVKAIAIGNFSSRCKGEYFKRIFIRRSNGSFFLLSEPEDFISKTSGSLPNFASLLECSQRIPV